MATHRASVVLPEPAHRPEDRLHEHRRRDQPLVQVVGQGVQVRGVVRLGLEPGSCLRADHLEHVLDVGVGGHERLGPGGLQVRLLPVVRERALVPVDHREAAVVHRAQVQRAQFRLELEHALQPILHAHPGAAAGGDAHDHVAAFLDPLRVLGEQRRIGRRAAVLRVPGVQVQHGRARLGRGHPLVGDVADRIGQVRRHRRGVPGSGERTGDDDLARHRATSWCSRYERFVTNVQRICPLRHRSIRLRPSQRPEPPRLTGSMWQRAGPMRLDVAACRSASAQQARPARLPAGL